MPNIYGEEAMRLPRFVCVLLALALLPGCSGVRYDPNAAEATLQQFVQGIADRDVSAIADTYSRSFRHTYIDGTRIDKRHAVAVHWSGLPCDHITKTWTVKRTKHTVLGGGWFSSPRGFVTVDMERVSTWDLVDKEQTWREDMIFVFSYERGRWLISDHTFPFEDHATVTNQDHVPIEECWNNM